MQKDRSRFRWETVMFFHTTNAAYRRLHGGIAKKLLTSVFHRTSLNTMRWNSAWAAVLVMSFWVPAAPAAERAPHALQGYGLVSLASPGEDAAVFRCEDDAAADRLLSKLSADFSWDRLAGPEKQPLACGATALRIGPHAMLAFACQGRSVYALSGRSAEGIERLMSKLGARPPADAVQGPAATPHVAGFLRPPRGEHVLLAAERPRSGRGSAPLRRRTAGSNKCLLADLRLWAQFLRSLLRFR